MPNATSLRESTSPLATAASPRSARVQFLGVGVQKAGTTWLHRMLAAHPAVFMAQAEDKDLKFFNASYDYGYEWYERHFAAAPAGVRCGEFSTSYFYSKDAPERVHRYNPQMRLVLSLRDPVKRAISHHKHEIRVGRLDADVPFEKALESNPSYVEQSMYFTQLSRWLEHFPLSSFHVVIFEEMFRDPARTVRELYEFVGVDSSFVPETLHEKINEGRIPRSRALDAGMRFAASGVRKIGGGWLIESLKKAHVDRWIKKRNSREERSTEIDPAVIAQLRADLAPENAKLAELLGRDLSVWSGAARKEERSWAGR